MDGFYFLTILGVSLILYFSAVPEFVTKYTREHHHLIPNENCTYLGVEEWPVLITGCPVETTSFTYILFAEKIMLGEMVFKKRERTREREKKKGKKKQEEKKKKYFQNSSLYINCCKPYKYFKLLVTQ